MNVFAQLLWILLFIGCPLTAVLFFVHLFAAARSPKVLEQVRKHPAIHAIWGCSAFVGAVLFLNPDIWPPRFVERQQQQQRVLERVQKAGGWEAVRRDCETLAANHPEGYFWFSPGSKANGPLPPAIAALHPRLLYYYPPDLSSKDGLRFAVVRIKIFGIHSTGGHSTPYFGLEVVCSTNSENYRPGSSALVSGNGYNDYEKVTGSIYEVF